MLVVTKNRTKRVGGWQRQLCSQAVGALEFFGELYSLAKGFGPFLRGVWAGFREREGSIFSNHQHFAVSTGICGVACPLPASRVDKPLQPANYSKRKTWVGMAFIMQSTKLVSAKMNFMAICEIYGPRKLPAIRYHV